VPAAKSSSSITTEPGTVLHNEAPANGGRTLSGSLIVLTDGLDFAIGSTNSANVQRLQHLNNARSLAVRGLEIVNAARISTDNTSRAIAPEASARFQLPDELQGVDPALIGTYNVLNVAVNTLARSTGDPGIRARIAGDLDTIGNEILAALTASKEFNAAGGRGRGGPVAGSPQTLPAALNFVANRLDYVINTSRPANVERVRHLNNARAVAGRALEAANAAGSSTESTSRSGASEATNRFQLPEDLQGVDPQLIGIYNSLNSVDALARSSSDPELRARIAGDLDTIGNEILAALTATKVFSGGRGNRGTGGQAEGRAPNPK
jgi:hypothetical protein